MKNKSIYAILTFFIACITLSAQEIETETETRAFVELGFSPAKNLNVSLSPEFRFDENLSFDKLLLETMVVYKIVKPVSVGVQYRFGINPKDTKPTNYYHRYAFQVVGKHSISDFTGSLRLRYANDTDEEETDKEFMRYKFGLKYNIPKCKLTPSVGVEAFQQLASTGLYKMRYSGGLSYKVKKDRYLKIKYRFDYYMQDYLNSHIFAIGYEIKI